MHLCLEMFGHGRLFNFADLTWSAQFCFFFVPILQFHYFLLYFSHHNYCGAQFFLYVIVKSFFIFPFFLIFFHSHRRQYQELEITWPTELLTIDTYSVQSVNTENIFHVFFSPSLLSLTHTLTHSQLKPKFNEIDNVLALTVWTCELIRSRIIQIFNPVLWKPTEYLEYETIKCKPMCGRGECFVASLDG